MLLDLLNFFNRTCNWMRIFEQVPPEVANVCIKRYYWNDVEYEKLKGILILFLQNIFVLKYHVVFNHHSRVLAVTKGQLISKCPYGVFNSSKNERKYLTFSTIIPQVELFLFIFWKNWRYQKKISKLCNWPLGSCLFDINFYEPILWYFYVNWISRITLL